MAKKSNPEQQLKNYLRFVHYLKKAGQMGMHNFDMKKISKWSGDAETLAMRLAREFNFEFNVINDINNFDNLEEFCRTKLDAIVVDRIIQIDPPSLNENRERRLGEMGR